MFGRLFGLKPLNKEKIRKSLYQPPIEEGGREEKYLQGIDWSGTKAFAIGLTDSREGLRTDFGRRTG